MDWLKKLFFRVLFLLAVVTFLRVTRRLDSVVRKVMDLLIEIIEKLERQPQQFPVMPGDYDDMMGPDEDE